MSNPKRDPRRSNIVLPDGRRVEMFVNVETRLIVIDVIDADDKSRTTILRRTLDPARLGFVVACDGGHFTGVTDFHGAVFSRKPSDAKLYATERMARRAAKPLERYEVTVYERLQDGRELYMRGV